MNVTFKHRAKANNMQFIHEATKALSRHSYIKKSEMWRQKKRD